MTQCPHSACTHHHHIVSASTVSHDTLIQDVIRLLTNMSECLDVFISRWHILPNAPEKTRLMQIQSHVTEARAEFRKLSSRSRSKIQISTRCCRLLNQVHAAVKKDAFHSPRTFKIRGTEESDFDLNNRFQDLLFLVVQNAVTYAKSLTDTC